MVRHPGLLKGTTCAFREATDSVRRVTNDKASAPWLQPVGRTSIEEVSRRSDASKRNVPGPAASTMEFSMLGPGSTVWATESST